MRVDRPFRAGVIGHPVQHSLSPDIFQYLSEVTGTSVDYKKIPVSPLDLEKWILDVRSEKSFPLNGWNVTLPHKSSILRHLDEVSPDAEAAGAVNVVHATAQGGLKGYNTDYSGLLETLSEQGIPLRGKRAVIFGAGGAAMAATFAFGKSRVAQVFIVNRNSENARRLAEAQSRHFSETEFFPLPSEDLAALQDVSIYLNATPVGLDPLAPSETFESTFTFPNDLCRTSLAMDLIYRSQSTPFLRKAKEIGLRTITGLDMLIWQAIQTWEIWFGPLEKRSVHKNALQAILTDKLQEFY